MRGAVITAHTPSAERLPLWRMPAIRKLLLITLLGFTSFDLTLASLPSWAVAGGAGVGAAGSVTAALLLATVLVQLVVPPLVARLGAGRVLAIGLLALGAPAPLYILSQDLRVLVALSIVRGAGFAILTVVGTLLTFSLAPAGKHGESVGLYGLVIAVPNLLALPAGVALLQADLFGWAAALAGAPVLAVPLAWGLHARDTAASGDRPHAPRRAAVVAVLSPALVLFAVTVAVGGVLTVLPIERPSGQLATAALLVLGVTTAVSRWQAGGLADRVPSRWWLPGGVVLSVVGAGVLALGMAGGENVRSDAVVLVAAALLGAGQGAVQNLSLINAFARAGVGRASTASAVWNAGFDAGTGLGAFAVGAISATVVGFAGTLAVCAGVIALTLPLAVRSSRAALSRGSGGG